MSKNVIGIIGLAIGSATVVLTCHYAGLGVERYLVYLGSLICVVSALYKSKS